MSNSLRFDGLYASDVVREQDGIRLRYYLRFYADGWVVTVAVAEPSTAEQVARWLNLQSPGCPIGQYSLDDGALRFTACIPESIDHRDGTTTEGVHIDYSGEVRGETLLLASHSHTTGAEREEQYQFRPVR